MKYKQSKKQNQRIPNRPLWSVLTLPRKRMSLEPSFSAELNSAKTTCLAMIIPDL